MSTDFTARLTGDLFHRICGEYTEMPGLRLTLPQAQRLWDLDATLSRLALDSLVQSGFLKRTENGQYLRRSDGPVNAFSLRMAKADLGGGAGAQPCDRPAAS